MNKKITPHMIIGQLSSYDLDDLHTIKNKIDEEIKEKEKRSYERTTCACGDDENCKKCGICKNAVCKECYDSEIIKKSEWMDIDSRCCRCQRIGCDRCMTACCSCLNLPDEDSDLKSYCRDCSNLRSICSHHEWTVCDKTDVQHSKCGSCKANKGYARYGY